MLRRDFLRLGVAGTAPYWFSSTFGLADEVRAKTDRPRFGVIGCGGIARAHGKGLPKLGDVVALCDVDRSHAEAFNAELAGGKAAVVGDHRALCDRKDVDAVLIATPDHWHVKAAADALRSGKDVYCEKPLTLTVDEGRFLSGVVKETGRVLQVGTQQRSDDRFLAAVAMAHAGRVGKLKRVIVAIGGGPTGGPFEPAAPPAGFDFDRWLGQAPKVEYVKDRTHGNFRWWYEYSGGKLTDWGAHHVDIAQWACAPDLAGPATIEPVEFKHPVPFEKGYPTDARSFNTATSFRVKALFAHGVEMVICDKSDEHGFDNGIRVEGETGDYFVNRGKLTGKPADDLKANPLPEAQLKELRKGRERMSHWANFLAACRDRRPPISDVDSHVRHLNTCHLAAIAIRLGRKLTWDAANQQIVGDAEANGFLRREQRKGYEVV